MSKQQTTNERRWYVLHTYSGYEDAVAKNLRQRIESLGMEDKIFNVMVLKKRKLKLEMEKREPLKKSCIQDMF